MRMIPRDRARSSSVRASLGRGDGLLLVGATLVRLAAVLLVVPPALPAENYFLGRLGRDSRADRRLEPGIVYDGGSADHVDDFLRKVPENSTIYLANHTFETRGVWDPWLGDQSRGFRVRSGWTLKGAGTNAITGTIFKLVDVPIDDSGHYHLNTVFSTGAVGLYRPTQPLSRRPNVRQVTISDLQIDCNYPGLARAKGTGALQLSAIQLLGSAGIRISNVWVRHAVSRKLDERGDQLECFQVYLYNKWAAEPQGDYVIDRVAVTDYQGGYTSAICVNGNATGIVQNCTVDLASDRSQRYALNFAAGIHNFTFYNNTLMNARRAINNDTGPICRNVTIVSNQVIQCGTGFLLANSRASHVIDNTLSLDGSGCGIAIRFHPGLAHVQSGACTVRGNIISGPDGEGISLGYHNEFDRDDATLHWAAENVIQSNILSAVLQNKIPPAHLAANIIRPGNRRHREIYSSCHPGQDANLAAIGFPSDIGPGAGCYYCDAKAIGTTRGYIGRVKLHGTRLEMRSDEGDGSGYSDFTTGYSIGVQTNRFKRAYQVQWADLHRGRAYRMGVHPEGLHPAYPPRFRVYIDFNHDGTFDHVTELVAAESRRNHLDEMIRIPRTALAGSTRMRVLLGCGQSPDPCGQDTFWGEVEDYTVSIVP